jgi:hypothetical protein
MNFLLQLATGNRQKRLKVEFMSKIERSARVSSISSKTPTVAEDLGGGRLSSSCPILQPITLNPVSSYLVIWHPASGIRYPGSKKIVFL